MSQTLPILALECLAFPSPNSALLEPNGLLALGGDLSIKRLCSAYQQGIFPWYSEHDPIMWWSPSPRAVIPTQKIKINRTLRKFLNKNLYTVTLNKAFNDVITLCANAPFRTDSTWIVPEMLRAYQNLHQAGHAHSIEVWDKDELVGGLYGVAVNGFFSGESMFYAKANASKVALVNLAKLLNSAGIGFIDCQLINPFLADMGCIEINRAKFESLKNESLAVSLPHNFWQKKQLTPVTNTEPCYE